MKSPSSTSSSEQPAREAGGSEPGLLRRVVIRVLVFGALLAPVTLLAHTAIRYAGDYQVTRQNADAVYFWGDSTCRRGVDLPELRRETGRPAFTLAMDSAGPYDLFGFAERVPAGSTAILNPHAGMPIRARARLYERSGLSLAGLLALRRAGYSPNDLLGVLMNNRDPLRPRFRTEHYAWPDSESLMVLPEQRQILAEEDTAVDTRGEVKAWARLFDAAVGRLRERDVEVLIVAVPLSAEVLSFWDRDLMADFGAELRAMAGEHVTVYDEVPLPADRNCFYDLVHLNRYGRRQFTGFLLDRIPR